MLNEKADSFLILASLLLFMWLVIYLLTSDLDKIGPY